MEPEIRPICSTPPQAPLPLPAAMSPERQSALMVGAAKWVNGTALRYAFFDKSVNPAWAPPSDAYLDAVRAGFEEWKQIGLGLEFKEVDDLEEAEVRIAFEQNGESWSRLGRDVLQVPANRPTMNLGWDVTVGWGKVTRVHEIGHTLGMPHEHQSPFSGIVWNEQAVYQTFEGPPNSWTRDKIHWNILRKLDPAQFEGSSWDPESVMEYPFPDGLITEPEAYRQGIKAPDGISKRDIEWMRKWYPGDQAQPMALEPFKSKPLELAPAQQADFAISPPESRRYEVATFGAADTVIVLFEEVDGELRFLAGDDDSGEDRNARLDLKLFKDRNYVLRVRLYWADLSGRTAVMYW